MAKMYIVTNPMPEHNNSPAVSLGKFVQVIRAAGYAPSVIGARLPEKLPGVADDVPVRSFGYGGKGIFKILSFGFLQLKTFFYCLCKFHRGDSVYFWIADKMIGAYTAAKIKGAKTNFFLYGKINSRHTKAWARSLEQYMTDNADFVCAEAESVFGECRIPEGKRLSVIKLFVPEFAVEPKPYSERERIVAVMSRLSAEKHPLETIRAVCRVREEIPDLRLRIIGGGPMEKECRELVSELGADGFIEFTGWLPSSEAKKQLSECVLLMYPAEIEGVPGGILEAMSFGIPALASPVGGIPCLIDDGVDGVFLSGTDSEIIAEELLSLLQSDKLEKMSAAAKRKIEREFSLQSAAENFRSVTETKNAQIAKGEK